MRKVVRRLGWVLLGLTLLLAVTSLAGWGYLRLNGPALADRLLTYFAKTEVDFSKLRVQWMHTTGNRWNPRNHELRLTLWDLSMEGTNPNCPGRLMEIDSLVVQLDLWSLLLKEPTRYIRLVHGHGGWWYLETEKRGVNNMKIFRQYDPNRPNPPDLVLIDTLRITQVDFVQHTMHNNRTLYSHIDTALGQLRIRHHFMDVRSHNKLQVYALDLNGYPVLEDTEVELDFNFRFFKPDKVADLDSTVLRFGGANFLFDGLLGLGPLEFWDLQFQSQQGQLASLFRLIPKTGRSRLANYTAAGDIDLRGRITGKPDPGENAHVEMRFATDSAALYNRQSGVGFRRLALRGAFTNGARNNASTTAFYFDTLRGEFGKRPFFGRLALTNPQDPYLEGSLQAELLVADVQQFLDLGLPGKSRGEVGVDLKLAGKARDLQNPRAIDRVTYNGRIWLDRVYTPGLLGGALDLADVHGQLRLQGAQLNIDSLAGRVNQQPLRLSGGLPNLAPYLLYDDPELRVRLNLHSPALNLAELLPRDMQRDTTQPFQVALPKLPGLDVLLALDLHQVRLGGGVFDQVGGVLRYSPEGLRVDTLRVYRPNDSLGLSLQWLPAPEGAPQALQAQVGLRSQHALRLARELGGDTAVDPELDTLLARARLSIRGNLHTPDSTQPSYLRFGVRLTEGSLQRPSRKLNVQDMQLRLSLTEKHLLQPEQAYWRVDTFHARANGFPLGGSLRIPRLADQTTYVNLSSRMDVPTFMKLFKPVEGLSEVQGGLNFRMQLMGPYTKLSNLDSLLRMDVRGQVAITGGQMRYQPRNLWLRDLYCRLNYDTRGVQLDLLSTRIGERTQLEARGYLQDILSYFYLKDRPLVADLRLDADTLDLLQLLARDGSQPEAGLYFSLPDQSDLALRARADYITYGELAFDALRLNSSVQDRRVCVEQLELKLAEGELSGAGLLDARNPQALQINAELTSRHLPLHRLLPMLEPYTGPVLPADSFAGALTGNIRLAHTLPASLQGDPHNLDVQLNLLLEQGLLTHFEPLQKLKLLYRNSELDTLRFDLYLYQATLVDGALVLPSVRLESNLMRIRASGTHRLEGPYHYHLAVNRVRRRHRDDYLNSRARLRDLDLQRTLLLFELEGDGQGENQFHYDWRRFWQSLGGRVRRF